MRDRLATVLEHCYSKRGFEPPRSIASWEAEAILTWRDRNPLILNAYELDMLANIETTIIGHVSLNRTHRTRKVEPSAIATPCRLTTKQIA